MTAKGSALAIIGVLAMAAAPVAAMHTEIGATRCLDCHTALPLQQTALTFQVETGNVCRQCHQGYHSQSAIQHPVDIAPSMKIPADMPLDIAGRLTCITCHSYHPGKNPAGNQQSRLLRRPNGKTLCFCCHKKW